MENVSNCTPYGFNMHNLITYETISQLIDDPKFNEIGFMDISSGIEYNINYPKNLIILSMSYDIENDTNYSNIPDTVLRLRVHGNGLPKLPNNLEVLKCDECKLTDLPSLTNTLRELYCSKNNIEYLPHLPRTLEVLCCNKNGLKELPELPNGITLIECQYNRLNKLPEIPNSLMAFYCAYNKITKLPFSLEKCIMDVPYYEDLDIHIQEAKKRNDKYEYFIFHDNPVYHFIWKTYNGKEKGIDGIKKMGDTNRINWYFKRLRAIQKIEFEYNKRRFNPKYGFCKYMEIKKFEELCEVNEITIEVEL